nr:hypothetical protein CFP56_70658 [Quercus suber]
MDESSGCGFSYRAVCIIMHANVAFPGQTRDKIRSATYFREALQQRYNDVHRWICLHSHARNPWTADIEVLELGPASGYRWELSSVKLQQRFPKCSSYVQKMPNFNLYCQQHRLHLKPRFAAHPRCSTWRRSDSSAIYHVHDSSRVQQQQLGYRSVADVSKAPISPVALCSTEGDMGLLDLHLTGGYFCQFTTGCSYIVASSVLCGWDDHCKTSALFRHQNHSPCIRSSSYEVIVLPRHALWSDGATRAGPANPRQPYLLEQTRAKTTTSIEPGDRRDSRGMLSGAQRWKPSRNQYLFASIPQYWVVEKRHFRSPISRDISCRLESPAPKNDSILDQGICSEGSIPSPPVNLILAQGPHCDDNELFPWLGHGTLKRYHIYRGNTSSAPSSDHSLRSMLFGPKGASGPGQ